MKTVKPTETEIVGLTLEEVKAKWQNVHTASIDGVSIAKTMILSPNRMNVVVEKGIVTKFLGYN